MNAEQREALRGVMLRHAQWRVSQNDVQLLLDLIDQQAARIAELEQQLADRQPASDVGLQEAAAA